MKHTISNLALFLAFISFSSTGFAASKICGQIQQRGGDLIFVQDIDGGEYASSIYADPNLKTRDEVQKKLTAAVNKNVCVWATSDEGDVVVESVL